MARSTFSGREWVTAIKGEAGARACRFSRSKQRSVMVFLRLKMAGDSEKVGYLVVKLLYGSWYCSWKKGTSNPVASLFTSWWVLDDLGVPNVWENPNLRSVDPITNHSLNSINEPWLRVIISIIPVIINFQANTTKVIGRSYPSHIYISWYSKEYTYNIYIYYTYPNLHTKCTNIHEYTYTNILYIY